jgi:ABC-type glycerol-3-phosphate transport system substrate-binding protein
VQSVSQGETLYGLPVSFDTTALFLIRGAPTLTTLDEMVEQARIGNRVALFSDGFNAFWGMGSFAGPPPAGADSFFVPEGWPSQEALVAWFEWMQQAEDAAGIQLNMGSRRAIALFTNQRLAYYAGNNAQLAEVMEIMSADQVETTLLPAGPAGPATPLLRSQALFFPRALFSGNGNGADQQAGLSFATYLSSAEAQNLLLQSGERLPTNRLVDLSQRPVAQAFITQAGSAIPYPPPGGEETLTRLDEITRAVLSGDLTPSEAAEQLLNRPGSDDE